MIVEEFIETDLVRRYSDLNVLIQQVETGDTYAEAIDLRSAPIHYIETDIPIEEDSDDDSEEDPEEVDFEGESAE